MLRECGTLAQTTLNMKYKRLLIGKVLALQKSSSERHKLLGNVKEMASIKLLFKTGGHRVTLMKQIASKELGKFCVRGKDF